MQGRVTLDKGWPLALAEERLAMPTGETAGHKRFFQ